MIRPLVIGLGNTYRGDDGVGPAVLARLAHENLGDVDLVRIEGDPLDLLEVWTHRRVLVIDAVRSGREPGTVIEFNALKSELPIPRLSSSHSLGLNEVIELARTLERLPQSLWLIGIEANEFAQGLILSPRVRGALDTAVSRVISLLTTEGNGRN